MPSITSTSAWSQCWWVMTTLRTVRLSMRRTTHSLPRRTSKHRSDAASRQISLGTCYALVRYRACVFLAESFSPSCRTWKNHVHLWTSGHRGTDGITVDWVLNYKTACSTSATIKYRMAYTNWRNKQPDNHHNGENCVRVSLLNNYTWNDIPCHFGYCFVCENRGAS